MLFLPVVDYRTLTTTVIFGKLPPCLACNYDGLFQFTYTTIIKHATNICPTLLVLDKQT